MMIITDISAIEILDSRGRPTIKTKVRLDNGSTGAASVPSGASTGAAEARELRDQDMMRFNGLGCLNAIGKINGEIASAIQGQTFSHPFELDQTLVQLDGTLNKARLGANAILSVSLAFVRACAASSHLPMYQFIGEMVGNNPSRMPVLTINLFSGGAHADGQVAIQDCLLVPQRSTTIASLELVADVYRSAQKLIRGKYNMRALTADEGGLAPQFGSSEEMLCDAMEAINLANHSSDDVALALDVAASQFYKNGRYDLDSTSITSAQMIETLSTWVETYPIMSVEDGLAEDDWDNWPKLTKRLGERCISLGDDLLCTNPKRIAKAVDHSAANALLLKVNQIGTLAEAWDARQLAKDAGWKVVVSARSGETEDDWLADLAVGWSGDFIKVGSIQQSERLAKYNRLLEIEAETGFRV